MRELELELHFAYFKYKLIKWNCILNSARIISRPGLITVLFDEDNEQPVQEFSCVFLLHTLAAYKGGKKKKTAPFPRWHFSDIFMWSVSGEVGQKLIYMFK